VIATIGRAWIGLAALTTTAGTMSAQTPAEARIGLQLYSVRDAIRTDLPSTLRRVHDLGFTDVELYDLHGLTPERLRHTLTGAGLVAVSMHVPLAALETNLADVVATARALGVTNVGVAWIKRDDAPTITADDIHRATRALNGACRPFRDAGLRPFYHVHGYEFQAAPNGGTLFDLFLGELDRCVELQLDVFWAARAGQDPAGLIRRYPGRITSLHVKDMRKGANGAPYSGNALPTDFVALGTGQIDMKAVLREAGNAGVRWYFVEDESGAVWDQLPVSLRFLRSELRTR
jgi:sugar phosphate isomerase/epimerase